MEAKRIGVARDLPLVLLITVSVVGLPLALLTWAEAAFRVTLGPLPAAAIAVGLTAVLGTTGSALWMRHPRSRDIVFGELLLWGYVRRLLNERRVLRATAALGLDRSNGDAREIGLTTEKQTEILQRLANALEANDAYTSGHSRRVARHSRMIAKQMGLSAEYVDKVYTAASIHDVGKIHLPREVLNKPGRLTDDEYEIIKEHSAVGASMVAALGNGEITAIVRHHHERLDGRGYPDRLEGDAIPMGSRIIAVADTFDALTSTRAYRAASEHKKAIDILKKEAGSQLDGKVVDAFLRYYTGRRSNAWWSAITAVPERVLTWIASGIDKVGVAGLASGATAAGAAAVIAAGSIAGPVPSDTMDRVHPVVASANVEAATDGSSVVAGQDGTDQDRASRDRGNRDGGRDDREDSSGDQRTSNDDDGQAEETTDGGRSAGSTSDATDADGGNDSTSSGDAGAGDTAPADGSGSDNSGSGSDNSGSGSDNSGSGSDNSGSGSDGSGSDSDNSGSGSDSDNSGSGSDSDNSGSGSDSSGSGSDGDGDGGLLDVLDDDDGCLLGLICGGG